MERIYAWDKANAEPVYREPGRRYGDGQQDSDESPVWLVALESELPEGTTVDDLPDIDPEAPHHV